MKKYIAIFMLAVMLLSLTACAASPYQELIDMLDNQDYEGAMAYVAALYQANRATDPTREEAERLQKQYNLALSALRNYMDSDEANTGISYENESGEWVSENYEYNDARLKIRELFTALGDHGIAQNVVSRFTSTPDLLVKKISESFNTFGESNYTNSWFYSYDEQGRAVLDNNRIFRRAEINVVPDYNPALARTEHNRIMNDTTYYRGLNIISNGKPRVRPSVLHAAIPLTPNTTYNASLVNRTYNEIMSLGYFKSTRIAFEELPRGEEDTLVVHYAGDSGEAYTPKRFENINEGLLRCYILGAPSLKQSLNVELEGSTTSSFYGLAATLGYQNRNLFRGVETLNASVTFGYEYMKAPHTAKRKANELGFAVGLSFPRFVAPFRISSRNVNMPRTKVELTFNYQDRPYYRRDLSRATWTYSWRSLNGRYNYQFRPIDLNWINVSYIDEEFFNSLQNEYLRQSYRTQAIVGLSASYTYNNQNKNVGGNATLLRINFESAGNLLNLIEKGFSHKTPDGHYEILGVRYSQYVRGDINLSRKIVLGEKTAIAGRIFAGCGSPYGNSTALPFDRLFYVGGSNSMRGWTPRTLGPGNTPAQDTPYPVQMGDIRLEGNLEFRFPIWDMFHGATFIDVGNVWYLGRDKEEVPADGIFHFNKFYKQLGFNTGLGLRLDITFVILRLDWGIQLHNPNKPRENTCQKL